MFTADENQQVHGAMLQLLEVLSYAEKKDVYIMLDAEYTDINPTIVLVAKSLMKRFNKTKPTVQTTYQAYLKVFLLKYLVTTNAKHYQLGSQVVQMVTKNVACVLCSITNGAIPL